MKNTMKKMLFVMVLAILCVGMAMTANAEKFEDYEYSILDDGSVEITKYTGSSTDLIVWGDLEGMTVTSIASYAFAGNDELVSVFIPESVSNIGSSAFNICKSLECIMVSDDNDFYSSSNGVLFDKEKTTLYCYPLGKQEPEYILPESVITIGEYAFSGYENKTGYYGNHYLENITFSNNLVSIGREAFADCSALKRLDVSDSVKTIESYAFNGCTALKDVLIGNGIEYIGAYAFAGCVNINKVETDDIQNWCEIEFSTTTSNPVYYSGNLYYDSESVEYLDVSDDVSKIGKYAFYNCKSLKEVTFSENIEVIEKYAFYNCTSLENARLSDSITNIDEYCFYNCDSLNSIIIPDSVTYIGSYSFSNCDGLEAVKLSENISIINQRTFSDCTALKNIVIPDNVTIVGLSAFLNCANLENITIGKNVLEVYASAFENCTALKNVYISDLANWCQIKLGGNGWSYVRPDVRMYSNPLTYAENLYLNGNIVKTLVIPKEVSSISNFAFYNYKKLTDVIIHNGVVNIEQYAFDLCDFDFIHYIGSENQWQDITISERNTSVEEAEIHFDCYIVGAQDSTCTENGYTEGVYCSECDKFVTGHQTVSFGHKMGEWIETKAPTCTEKGEERRDCSRCDYFETREVEETDHKDGNNDGYCDDEDCNENICEHKNLLLVGKVEATCTESGYTGDKVCDKCGKTIAEGTSTKSRGHDVGEWIEVKVPTCTEKGEERRDCSRCDYFETREVEETDHKDGNNDGYCDNEDCNENICEHKNTTLIGKKEASCIENGYSGDLICCKCNEIIINGKVIGLLGHIFGGWTVEIEATCSKNGVEIRKCTRCNECETNEIPKREHMDADNDNSCDECNKEISLKRCSHLCHSNNFIIKIIWKILRFIFKLFNVNRICACGIAHY